MAYGGRESVWQLHELKNLWSVSRLQLAVSSWGKREREREIQFVTFRGSTEAHYLFNLVHTL